MKKRNPAAETGAGKATVFVLFVVVLALIILAFKIFSREAPAITAARPVRAIGRSTPVSFEIRDPEHAIRSVQLEIEQGGETFPVRVAEIKNLGRRKKGWRFWRSGGGDWVVSADIGRQETPDLKSGSATLRVIALNDSWGRLFRGGRRIWEMNLPVRLAPPPVQVLTTQAYLNQGGSGMVVFKVSQAAESGVQVGNDFFPSWPAKASDPTTRLCLFAFPYDAPPDTPIQIVASDDAGNRTVANFTYKVFPKTFKKSTMDLTDDFLQRVVPAIMSQTPELKDQGSLIKNFLQINGWLRRVDAEKLVELSKQTQPQFLWSQPFIELPSKVESSFADARTYTYHGQVVDHQTHLGFDLAGTQHMPVLAANDGVVIFAQYFGIYGNAIVIDHGCGLQSLYGHLASFEVKPGDRVKRGQVIAHTDTTGLAGGDHLHFTILVDGMPVTPIEWWDAHWIRDHIESQLALVQ